MTSASDLLGAAADRIRDLAAAASQGEWKPTDLADHGHRAWWVECERQSGEGTAWHAVADLSNVNAGADARWIAALSPAVAPHLEAIFRQAAKEAADHEENSAMAEVGYCPLEKSAMALAHALCPELAGEQS